MEEANVCTKGLARITMARSGRFKIYIQIETSKYTPYRFVESRDFYSGKLQYKVREFDPDTGVFYEISEDEDLCRVYEGYEETFEDAVKHLRNILEEIAKEDKLLAAKERREEFTWTTSPDGVVEIQAKLPQ